MLEASEEAQPLRALAAFTEDPVWFAAPTLGSSLALRISVPGDQRLRSGLRSACAGSTYGYASSDSYMTIKSEL